MSTLNMNIRERLSIPFLFTLLLDLFDHILEDGTHNDHVLLQIVGDLNLDSVRQAIKSQKDRI